MAFQIAGWNFEPRSRTLTRGNVSKLLSPRATRLLGALGQSPGEVVRRDQLMDEIWPDVFVTDDSLTQAVAEVRRALGASGKQIIETVPKLGYRLSLSTVEKVVPSSVGEDAFDLNAYLLCLEARDALARGGPDIVRNYEASTREAVASNPEFAFARAEHATALSYQWLYQREQAGHLVEALEEADTAVRLRPDVASGYAARAFALAALRQPESAVSALATALHLNPNDAYTHFLGARIMYTLAQYPAAAVLAERAAQLRPDCIWALFFGARAAAAFDQPRSRRLATECLRRVKARLAVDSEDPRARNLLGPLQAMLGKSNEANQAIEAQPDQKTTLQIYDAIALAMLGKTRDAILAIEALVARGWAHSGWLLAEPSFTNLNENRRFRSILADLEQTTACV